MSMVKNRSEILFVYDVKDANPNGDPVDENKPRIDEETGINIVTDVRLKRTIRDYLYYYKKKDIFVREIEYEPGKIQDAKLRAEDFLIDNNGNRLQRDDINAILKEIKGKKPTASECLVKMKEIVNENIKRLLDVRLFGVTIPIEWNNENKDSITYTGPVQFKFGRSLHKVNLKYIKGTGAFASDKDSKQKTFRSEYILPYSLIAFYGIINEKTAIIQNLNLNEEDINLLLEAIWCGTKNLVSRSKIGHMPRLLIQIIYKENNFHIGELDKRIRFVSDKNDEEIRDVAEGKLDITDLVNALNIHKNAVKEIRYKVDERVILSCDGRDMILPDTLKGFDIKELIF